MDTQTTLNAPLTLTSLTTRSIGLVSFIRLKGYLPNAGWNVTGEAALTTSGVLVSLRTRQRPGEFPDVAQPLMLEYALGQLRPGERPYRVTCDGAQLAEGRLMF
ncbi:hypothetical protein [Rhodobacter capsulatus]|jgi:hypothetical protein|uniref:Uncharacterized protein n=1 Tax=Rhodobacter capsulatus (strain ATCC BAA-309 / NBRC 16581 / SB1003) TaxID=272942 RepID=D5AR43_RHOCB|nr:hypothetical protein [Rhodobacter capsulatus]ADE86848.1 hypothetical protein RCAP_rcc03124 [Rhodobacter capsulatus SB 1003]ETD00571.1 hypothetical protein U714_17060 [Rhodobacter capsulatus DE442]ETD74912.1 hypothetical protein U717_17025 [Rhodobacter capsulatus R121]ETD83887.1 hypothetical protein U703_07210 [Rhodobacter capsulatus YW1]ETD87528.1 hypothetical protein U716_01320 [Rhodobacter capsulatus B6]